MDLSFLVSSLLFCPVTFAIRFRWPSACLTGSMILAWAAFLRFSLCSSVISTPPLFQGTRFLDFISLE